MDDPESEWEIQELYPSSKEEESTSMVRWILNKGYGIGKKMVITGIVISSAPLVLPPLVVCSAMGVAVSVPFGLVFATYACTNKLMSLLLPTPPPPQLMLEYNYPLEDEDEKHEYLLTNLDEYEDEDRIRDVGFELDDGYGVCSHERDLLVTNFGENGYYSDDDDDVRLENRVRMEDNERIDDIEEDSIQNVNEKGGYVDEDRVERENVFQEEEIDDLKHEIDVGFKQDDVDESIIDEKGRNADEIEEGKEQIEDIVKESTGLLEKIRNNERLDNVVEPEPVTVKEIETQVLVGDERKDPESVGEIRHVVVLAGGTEDNNFNSREVAELDLVAREVVGDSDGGKDAILRAKRERLVRSNDDAREIGDESGLDLFDDRKESDNQNPNIDFKSLEANTEYAADENVDVMALPDFKRVPLDSGNKIASKPDSQVSFRKNILDDEKIWEKIEAMRAIVGFKAPRQPTCMAELKALYVFTGVEPPASFKDNSDLDEVNAKLKFLMSIVGVR